MKHVQVLLVVLLLLGMFVMPAAAEESAPLPGPQPTPIVEPIVTEGWNLKIQLYYDFNGNGSWDEHEGQVDGYGTIRYGLTDPVEWESTEENPYTTTIPKGAHVRIENVQTDYEPDERVCQGAEFDMPADADTISYQINLACRPTRWQLFISYLRRFWNPG